MSTDQANVTLETPTKVGGLRHQEWLWILSVAAGLRVFVFLSGFPFFGSTDEANHVDMVQRYAGGMVQRSEGEHLNVMGRWLVLYSSPEYTHTKETMPKGKPNYQLAERASLAELGETLDVAKFMLQTNHERGSPPVYYFVLACWLHLGTVLGIPSLHLLYWLRLPNVLAAMALVWIGYYFTKRWFPRWTYAPWGVAVLLAAMPQDIFYFVNPDILSCVLFPITLHWILAFGEGRTISQAAVAGAMVALLMMTKLSNVPIVAPMTLVGATAMVRPRPGRSWVSEFVSQLPMWILPGVVLGTWLVWNKWTVGDWTATAERFRILDWTIKPLAEMFHHPLFTLEGSGYFFSKLTLTFWQGEVDWHKEWMHRHWLDVVYASTSLVLVVVAVLSATSRRQRESASEGPVGILLLTIATSILWLIYLSLRFDFGSCYYPSRALPYFVSGRLIFGTAIPFAILYASGLGWLTEKLTGKDRSVVLLSILGVVVFLGELQLSIPVFESQYNWYRLWP